MKKIRHQGFTLIELLIGITVAAMVFILAGSIIGMLFKTDIKGQRIENFEQTKNDIAAEISNTVRWAQAIYVTDGDLGTLTADQTIYRIQNGRLFRNNDPLTPTTIKITKFATTDMSAPRSEQMLIDIQIEMESTQTATSKDSLNLVVSQRETTLEENEK